MAEFSPIDVLNSAVSDYEFQQEQRAKQEPTLPNNTYNLNAAKDAEVEQDALSEIERDAVNMNYFQLANKYGIAKAQEITQAMQEGYVDYRGDKLMEHSAWGDNALGVAKGVTDMAAGLGSTAVGTFSPQTGADMYKSYQQFSDQAYARNFSMSRQAGAKAISAVRAEQDRLNDYLYEEDIKAGKGEMEATLSAIGRDMVMGARNIAEGGVAMDEAIESAVGSLIPSAITAKGISTLTNVGTRALARRIVAKGASKEVSKDVGKATGSLMSKEVGKNADNVIIRVKAQAVNKAKAAGATAEEAEKLGLAEAAKAKEALDTVAALKKLGKISDRTAWALANGIMEGGAGFSETLVRIMDMDTDDMYRTSPGFADRVAKFVEEGLDKEEAEEQARLEVATIAARAEGAAQGLLGIATGAFTEGTYNLIRPSKALRPSGFINSVVGQPSKEAVEEGLQEGGGQFLQNAVVLQYADKNAKLYQNVGKNAVAGAFGGMASSHIVGAPHTAISTAVSGAKTTAKMIGASFNMASAMADKHATKTVEKTVFSDKAQKRVSETIKTAETGIKEGMAAVFGNKPEDNIVDSTATVKEEPTAKDSLNRLFTLATNLSEEEQKKYGTTSRTEALQFEYRKLAKAREKGDGAKIRKHAARIASLGQEFALMDSEQGRAVVDSLITEALEKGQLSEEDKAKLIKLRESMAAVTRDPQLKGLLDHANKVVEDIAKDAKNLSSEDLKKDTDKATAIGTAIILNPDNADSLFSKVTEGAEDTEFEAKLDAIQEAVNNSSELTETQKKFFNLARTAISSKRYISRLLKTEGVSEAMVNKAAENLGSGKSADARTSLDDYVTQARLAYMVGSEVAINNVVNGLENWYKAQNNRLNAMNTSSGKDPSNNKVAYKTYNPATGQWFDNEAYLNANSNNGVTLAKAAYAEAFKTYKVLKALGEITGDEQLKNVQPPVMLTHESFTQFNKNVRTYNSKFKGKINDINNPTVEETIVGDTINNVVEDTVEDKTVNTENNVIEDNTVEQKTEETVVPEVKTETIVNTVEDTVAEETTNTVEEANTVEEPKEEVKTEEEAVEKTKTKETEEKENEIDEVVRNNSFIKGKSEKFSKYFLIDMIYKLGDRAVESLKGLKPKNNARVWQYADHTALMEDFKKVFSNVKAIGARLAEMGNGKSHYLDPADVNRYKQAYFGSGGIGTQLKGALDAAFAQALELSKSNSALWDENGNFKADNYSAILQSPQTKILIFATNIDGKWVLDPKIKEVAAMAAFDWFLTAQFTSADADLSDLGVDLDLEQFNAFRSGAVQANLLRDLCSKMHAVFGSHVTYDQKPGYASAAIDQLSAEILHNIVNDSYFGAKKVLISDPEGNVVAQVIQFPNYTVKDPKDSSHNLLDVAGLFTDLLVQSREKPAYYDPEEVMSVRKTQLHSDRPLSDNEIEFVTHAQETKFYRDSNMQETILDLGEEGCLELFGFSGLPAPESDAESRYNVHDLESKRGKNLSISSAFETIRKEAAIFLANGLEYMRYAGAISSVGRYQMQGENNPQSSKLMRIVSTATKSEHMDLTKDNVRKLHNRCCAQGLGDKVHQMTDNQISEHIREVLTKDGIFARQIQPYFDAIANGEKPTAAQRKAFIEGFKALQVATGIDCTEWAMLSLKELALAQRAEKNGTLNDVTTYTFLEADGVTDGPINYAMMNGVEDFDRKWLGLVGKGGFSFFGKALPLLALKNVQGDSLGAKDDLYTATKNRVMSALHNTVSDIVAKLNLKRCSPEQIYQITNSVTYIWSVLGPVQGDPARGIATNALDNGIEPTRNTVKNPTTQLVYHAGVQSVANTMVQHNAGAVRGMTAVLYERISDYLACEADPEKSKLPMGVKFFIKEYDGTNAEALQNKFDALCEALSIVTSVHIYNGSTKSGITNASDRPGRVTSFDLKLILSNPKYAAIAEIRGNLLDHMVHNFMVVAGSIANSYKQNFESSYDNAQESALNAAKDISAIAEVAQETAIGELSTRGNYGLSEKEISETKFKYEGTASDTRVNGHLAPLSKQANGGPVKTVASSVHGGMEVQTQPKIASNPGVMAFANMNINMGDASMVMRAVRNLVAVAQKIPQVLLVFDGIHMGLNKIDQYAPEINEATSVAVKNNLFTTLAQKMKKSYDAFLKHADVLEKVNPEIYKSIAFKIFIEEQLKEDGMLDAGLGDYKPYVLNYMKAHLNSIQDYARRANARQFAMQAVGFSTDHMASSENPFYKEGNFADRFDKAPEGCIPTEAEVLTRLNAAKHGYEKAMKEHPEYFSPEGKFIAQDAEFFQFFKPYIQDAYNSTKATVTEDRFIAENEYFTVTGSRNGPVKRNTAVTEAVSTPAETRRAKAEEKAEANDQNEVPYIDVMGAFVEDADVDSLIKEIIRPKGKYDYSEEAGYIDLTADNLNFSDKTGNALYKLVMGAMDRVSETVHKRHKVRVCTTRDSFFREFKKYHPGHDPYGINGFYHHATGDLIVDATEAGPVGILNLIHHELIHAITADRIREIAHGAQATEAEKIAYNNLKRICEMMKSGAMEKDFKGTLLEDLYQHFMSWYKHEDDMGTAINEMLAYLSQNPETVEVLKQIKLDPSKFERSTSKGLKKLADLVENILRNAFTFLTGKAPMGMDNVWTVFVDSSLTLAADTYIDNESPQSKSLFSMNLDPAELLSSRGIQNVEPEGSRKELPKKAALILNSLFKDNARYEYDGKGVIYTNVSELDLFGGKTENVLYNFINKALQKEHNKSVVNTPVMFFCSDEAWTNMGREQGLTTMQIDNAVGYYTPATHCIYMNMSDKYATSDMQRTYLHHELMHAITVTGLDNAVKKGVNASNAEKYAYRNLIDLCTLVQRGSLDRFCTSPQAAKTLNILKYVLNTSNGLTRIKEVIAYLSQHPEMLAMLKNLAVSPGNYLKQSNLTDKMAKREVTGLQRLYQWVKQFFINCLRLNSKEEDSVQYLSTVADVIIDSASVFVESGLVDNYGWGNQTPKSPRAQEKGTLFSKSMNPTSKYSDIRDKILDQLEVLDHKRDLNEYKQLAKTPDVMQKGFYEKFDRGGASLAEVIGVTNALGALLPSWTQEQLDIATELGILIAHKQGLNADVAKVFDDAFDAFAKEYTNKKIAPEYEHITKVLLGQTPLKQAMGASKVNRSAMFAAMVLLDDNFRQIVGGIKIPGEKGTKTKNKLDRLAYSLGQRGFDALTQFYTGGHGKGLTVSNAVDALYEGLAYRSGLPWYLKGSVAGVVDKVVNKAVDKALDKTADYMLDQAKKANLISGKTRKLVNAVRNSGHLTAENFFEAASDLINETERVPQFIKDLINDVIGITDDNWSTYASLKKVRQHVQATRQQYNELLPVELLKLFKQEPTKEEHEIMYKVLSCIDVYGMNTANFENFRKLFIDPDAVDQGIADASARITEYYGDRFGAMVENQSMKLVRYLLTGKVGTPNLCVNAESIANFNFVFKKEAVHHQLAGLADSNIIAAIDSYITLSVIKNLDDKTKNKFAEVLKREPEAMASVVGLLYNYQQEEKLKTYNTKAMYNYVKGRITPHKTSDGSIIIRDASMRKELESQGYKVVEKYHGSIYDNQNQLVFYNPYATVRYNEGIIQLARPTANGTDIATGLNTGLNAGYITHPKLVKALTRYIAKYAAYGRFDEGNINSLVPVFDEQGNIIAYQRTVSRALEEKYLKPEHNILNVICRNKGRQVEEKFAQEANKAFIKKLAKQYDEAGNKDAFVDVFELAKKDKVVADALDRLPESFKRYVRTNEKLGGKFWVRRDMLNDTIGYRSASVGDIWTGKSRWSKEVLAASKIHLEAILGKNAYAYLRQMENWDIEFMTYVRNTIAVKSVVVPAINVVSNVFQLFANGVPTAIITRDATRKTKELENYLRVRQEILSLEAKKAGAQYQHEREAYDARIEQRRNYIKRLSISPLLEAGEFGIISNVQSLPEEMRFADGSLGSWIDRQADKVPVPLRNLYRYGLITKDTPMYAVLQKTVQYGDFVAKSILYDHLRAIKGMSNNEALRYVREEFVDYDKSMGRDRQYLETMGLLWFWNFKVRSIKAAVRNLRRNPFSALMASMGADMFVMDGVGTALSDNLIAKLMEGNLGYSVGMGPATKAITDNWLYALFN